MSSLKTLNPVNGRQCLILTADFNSDRYDSERMMMMIMMTTTIMSNSVSVLYTACLLYTSDAADDLLCVDLGGRRIIKKKITLTQ